MKKMNFLIFLLALNYNNIFGQNLLSESLCYTLQKVNLSYDKIFIISQDKVLENCTVLKQTLEFTNENDLFKLLKKQKVPLLEARISTISNSDVDIVMTWFNVHKKRNKMIKAIEGSIYLKYCFDCNIKKFVLCSESSNFH